MKNRILIIDGNFFAHRCIGILNQGQNINHLSSKEENELFKTGLKIQLYHLWKTFEKYCDNFILVADSLSWRKNIKPFEPYYSLPGEVLGYKEQREEVKKESAINYENFYYNYGEFVKELISYDLSLSVNGLEGDDLIRLIRDKLVNHDKIIFANDGDLEQLIFKNTIMYRNVRSKSSPDGEILISKSYFDLYLSEEDYRTKLLQNPEKIEKRNLIYINLFDNKPVQRKLGYGLKISQPFKTILTKTICGDKSDNILPIIKWKAKTGTRLFSVKDTHIEETLTNQFKKFDEDTSFQILKMSGNEELRNDLLEFIKDLLVVCNQPCRDDFARRVMNHYLHNLKLVFINPEFFPKESMTEFNGLCPKILDLLQTKELSSKELVKILGFESEDKVQYEDKISTLFKSSIQ